MNDQEIRAYINNLTQYLVDDISPSGKPLQLEQYHLINAERKQFENYFRLKNSTREKLNSNSDLVPVNKQIIRRSKKWELKKVIKRERGNINSENI